MNKMSGKFRGVNGKRGLFLALVVGLLSQGVVGAVATTIYDDRADWVTGLNGKPYWDVDLEDGRYNDLANDDTLHAGDPIKLPPLFTSSLSFNSALHVEYGGTGWGNYIHPGEGAPLVLRTSGLSLTGSFSALDGAKFGFEVLSLVGSTKFSLVLSDRTEYSLEVPAGDIPQFIGWIAPPGEIIDGFTISSSEGVFLIGNFVVPEGGATLGLFGIGLLVLAAARRKLGAFGRGR